MNREELKKCVLKQVEYYFSDENLVRGKFLRKKIQQSVDGWVHLNVLVTFKRLASLSTNVKVIGKLLFQSNSTVIEISKDRQRVRRIDNKPVLKKNRENISEMIFRSAYVEGFSKDLDIDFLIKLFVGANNVIIRNYFDKNSNTYKSKGSAFVTFPNRVQCDEFVKKTVVLNGEQLKIMHQENFIEEKKLLKAATAANKKNNFRE